MNTQELPETVGRPALAFRAFACPVGRERWSEDTLRDRWLRLIRKERKARKPKPAGPFKEYCAARGCENRIAINSKSGVCAAHLHSARCQCSSCRRVD